jgi:uncharacterized protein YcbK (DUF882 family)
MKTDIQLSPHFNLKEFLHNGSDEGLTINILENLRKTAQMMETIRSLCGNHPITITSGFRTAAHNKAVGGAPNSFHVKGMAADFVVAGVKPHQVQDILKDWHGGLELAPTWTHADWGPYRRFYP